MKLKIVVIPMVSPLPGKDSSNFLFEYTNTARMVQAEMYCNDCKNFIGSTCSVMKGSIPFRGNCFESRSLSYSPVSMKKL